MLRIGLALRERRQRAEVALQYDLLVAVMWEVSDGLDGSCRIKLQDERSLRILTSSLSERSTRGEPWP